MRYNSPDNVLYKVIIACILPSTTKELAVIKPYHLFILYALRHHLDIDIGLYAQGNVKPLSESFDEIGFR